MHGNHFMPKTQNAEVNTLHDNTTESSSYSLRSRAVLSYLIGIRPNVAVTLELCEPDIDVKLTFATKIRPLSAL